MDCTVASLQEFRLDLERRIAVVLHFGKGLPQGVVTNMAQTISRELGEFFDGSILLEGGPLSKAMDKLL